MKASRLDEAISEAKRFLARAEHLRDTHPNHHKSGRHYGSVDTGSVRRASLDLSRALSALRQDKG